MPELNRPAGLSDLIEGLDRRIRNLEVAARAGLGHARTAYGTASAVPAVFGSWESGAAGTTWADDQGNTGTGYAQLDVRTGTRALVMFGCRVINLASNTAPGGLFRSNAGVVGFGIGPATPDLISAPTGQRTLFNSWTSAIDFNVTFNVTRVDLTPGPNTFRAWARWQNTDPAGTALPQMTDVVLAVLPLDPPS